MTSFKTKISLALLALVAATGAAQAAPPLMEVQDLPILVDRFYEIKNPAGPVSIVEVPEELKRPQILYQVPNMELKDIPNPQELGQQQVLFQR